jgi:hypothetical protein
MQITKGKVNRAQRIVIYGPEGIGKSTLASLFPNPVFMDVEQGTDHLDVARTPRPASFEMMRQLAADMQRDPQGFQTLVVDTADWAERHAIVEVCSQNNISSLGGENDYGKSYNILEAKWAKWLDSLTEICMGKGIHIVVLAHAMMRKFEQPEEIGAFDRWEMKLQKKTSAVLKEWSDMLLFVSYKTLVAELDKSKRKKGTGGARVVRTCHHPCWDAKNRHDLPHEIPLTVENKTVLPAELLNIFFAGSGTGIVPQERVPSPQEVRACVDSKLDYAPPYETVTAPAPAKTQDPPIITPTPEVVTGPSIPASLIQLMEANNVTEEDIRKVVGKQGYYPVETPITNYEPDFINGVLVGAWDKVFAKIKAMKEG